MSVCARCGGPLPTFHVLLLGGSAGRSFCDDGCFGEWYESQDDIRHYHVVPPLRFEEFTRLWP